MAKIWEPQSIETLKYWIETILEEASDNLNEWETSFVLDIQYRVGNKWTLSQRQEEILERIYANKTK